MSDAIFFLLVELLSIREQQLERIAAQLNDVNHDFLHVSLFMVENRRWKILRSSRVVQFYILFYSFWQQQKGLVEVTDALERARSRCIELQVELSREKRLNKDLETRLWVRT